MKSALKSKIIGNNMNESKVFWDKMVRNCSPSLIPIDFDSEGESFHKKEEKLELTKEIDQPNFLAVVLKTIHNYLGNTNDYVLVDYFYKGKIVPLKMDLKTEESEDHNSFGRNIETLLQQIEDNIDYPIESLFTEDNILILFDRTIPAEIAEKYKIIISISKKMNVNDYLLQINMKSSHYSINSTVNLLNQISYGLNNDVNESIHSLNLLEDDLTAYKDINSVKEREITKTVINLIMENFINFKESVALVDGDFSLTYAELHDLSTKYYTFFKKNGIKDQRIAVSTKRSFNYFAAVIGIMRSGNCYVPVDLSFPQQRNSYILAKSEAGIIIIDENQQSKVQDFSLNKVTTFSEIEKGEMRPEYSKMDESTIESAAYVIFTSGTTGDPKGVDLRHKGLTNRLLWMKEYLEIDEFDVILQKTSLLFDVSVWELFLGLLSGAKTVLLKQGDEGNPERILETIERNSVTTLHFVPSMLSAFVQFATNEKMSKSFSSVNSVICSGERLSLKHSREFYKRFKDTKLYNFYGPTEATIDVTYEYVSKGVNQISIGKPIDNTKVFVINDNKQLCPVGMIGELYIGGVGLAAGYVNDTVKTNEVFVMHQNIYDGIMYKTGDLVRLRYDGRIEYYGRNDNQVKVRGFRIEIGEIENKLIQCSGIDDAIVLNHRGKDGLVHLEAFVINKLNSSSEGDLKKELSTFLPYYMIPDSITFVEKIPVTGNGKLDSNLLIKILEEKKQNAFVEPKTESERKLKIIFEDVLDQKPISIQENFFSIGGNSINTISIIAKAKKENLNFDFKDIFLNPTIQKLAKKIDENSTKSVDDFLENIESFSLISDEDKMRIPEDIEDSYPMSYLQMGLVYQCAVMKGGNNYHDIVSYLIRGRVNEQIFKKAVTNLVNDQQIFRTSFNMKDYSENLQLVHKNIDKLPLEIVDLRSIKSKKEQDQWYKQWFFEEEHKPFDFSKPGLVKFHIHILSDDQYRYSISQHNSALDGWSMNKIHTYLFQKYFELLNNQLESSTHEITNNDHNRNFIYLEQKAVKDSSQTNYWKSYLKNIPNGKIPKTKIPSKSDLENDQVVFQDIILSSQLSENLMSLSRNESVPIKDILLAAHMKFLELITDSNDILSGYEIGGRPEIIGSEDALGLFLNTMPFRLNLKECITWRDLIQETYKMDCECLPYRRYPMAKIKQDLKIRDILFEPVFNYTHFYALKELEKFDELDLMNVKAGAVTEFPLRTEFSRHHFTDEIQLSLHYHTALFNSDDILEFGEIFKEILHSMVENVLADHKEIRLSNELKGKLSLNLNNYSIKNQDKNALKSDLRNVKNEEDLLLDIVMRLKSIWKKVLENNNDISMLDDFFEIGGDSIKALQISLKVGEESLSVMDVLSNSRLLDMALLLLSKQKEVGPELISDNVFSTWSKLLDVNIEKLTYDTDFFDVGGDSIKALRLSQELGMELIDILQNPTIREQVRCLSGKRMSYVKKEQTYNSEYLKCMYEGISNKAIVFFPYAAGTPLNYRLIAKSLHSQNPTIGIYAVSYPGHDFSQADRDLEELDKTVSGLVNDIKKSLYKKDIYFWGHCIGSSFALATAERLRKSDINICQVIIAGKEFRDIDEITEILKNVKDLDFEIIQNLFESGKIGSSISNLTPDQKIKLVNIFKHDSKEANTYIKKILETGKDLKDIQTSLIFSKDDPETENYERSIKDWNSFTTLNDVYTIEKGGHYFAETKSNESADLINIILNNITGGKQ